MNEQTFEAWIAEGGTMRSKQDEAKAWSPSAAREAARADATALRETMDLPAFADRFEAHILDTIGDDCAFDSPGAAGGLCAFVFPYARNLWALIEATAPA